MITLLSQTISVPTLSTQQPGGLDTTSTARVLLLLDYLKRDVSSISSSGGVNGLVLLSTGTVNLNTTITCTFTSSGINFQPGMTVQDGAGNTGVIVTTDGSSTMTLTDMIPASPPTPATFSGTITGAGTTTATAGNQTISLVYTSVSGTFQINDVVTDIPGNTGTVISVTGGTLILGSLSMVSGSGFTGTITGSLSSATGTAVSNDLILLFTALSGAWAYPGTVSDGNGNSGKIIINKIFPTYIILNTLTFSGSTPDFSGTISESLSATGSVVSFNWGDIAVSLNGASNFLLDNPTLIANGDLSAGADFEIWGGLNRTGNQLSYSANYGLSPSDGMSLLTGSGTYIDSIQHTNLTIPIGLFGSNYVATNPTVYITMGTPVAGNALLRILGQTW